MLQTGMYCCSTGVCVEAFTVVILFVCVWFLYFAVRVYFVQVFFNCPDNLTLSLHSKASEGTI